MQNDELLLGLGLIYVTLTEAMAEVTGHPVEMVANRILMEMLPGLPPEIANLGRMLLEHGSTEAVREGARVH
jgi:hypothetical protein